MRRVQLTAIVTNCPTDPLVSTALPPESVTRRRGGPPSRMNLSIARYGCWSSVTMWESTSASNDHGGQHMTVQGSRATFPTTDDAMMRAHAYALTIPAPGDGAPPIQWPWSGPTPWPWPGPFPPSEAWRYWQAGPFSTFEPLPAPVFAVSGLGLRERVRAAKVAATLMQVIAFAQNQGQAWNHGEQEDVPKVAAEIKALLDASEPDMGWLATVIAEKQQQFEIAFASALAALPVAYPTKVKVAAGLQKRGGVAEFALEALAQFRDAEARTELIGSGKARLSSLGAYCMGSAGVAGALLAWGRPLEAVFTGIQMAAAGCLDL